MSSPSRRDTTTTLPSASLGTSRQKDTAATPSGSATSPSLKSRPRTRSKTIGSGASGVGTAAIFRNPFLGGETQVRHVLREARDAARTEDRSRRKPAAGGTDDDDQEEDDDEEDEDGPDRDEGKPS